MANEKYGKGIGIVSGFDLGAAVPVDSKYVVNDAAEMQAHVTNNRAYKGMQVYNLADSKLYIFDGQSFIDYSSAISQGVATKVSISGDVNSVTTTVGGAVSTADVTLTLKDITTAGTGTKVTVNAKGLITSIEDATTTDIAEGDNLYYTEDRATANFNTNIVKVASTSLTDGTSIYRKGEKTIQPADIVLDEDHRFITDAEKATFADKYTKTETDNKIDEKIQNSAYVHPESGVTAGTYRSVTVDTKGHVTAGTNPTTLAGYGITDANINAGVITLGANTITPLTAASDLDATKLKNVVPLSCIPRGALERLVVVTDAEARLALTADDVQNGDTVKQNSDGVMYYVKDDTQLNSEDGWAIYTAGSATTAPWSGITGKPSTFTPPTASGEVLGGIKVGSNLSISDGVLSISSANITSALGYTPPSESLQESDIDILFA